ncbi:MAG: ribose 5-phosphate isomerase B [Acidobacteriota bacterium]|jgi:ribose 5-phosphate isomerase B|nr:ribose 5-phosphate isomerase B [Acidobacteriota bacterium]
MIVIASDHAGVDLKARIVELVSEIGHEVRDLGPVDTTSVDYPDFAHAVARAVETGEAERGILVCGTGIGMSLAANRHPQVRAALCHDAFTAEMARCHNDANVLCIGSRSTGPGVAEQIVRIFLETSFEGGRHQRRVEKIEREG